MPNSVERVSGTDRYNTSLSISKEFNALLDSSTSVVYNRDNINDGPCSKLIVINGDPTIVDASVIGVYAADRRRPIICL
jgi:putative cell wall-binding protein